MSFTVDPKSLEQVANSLNSLGPTMQKMKSTGQADTGQIGGDEIVSAVTGFAGKWNYGAGLLEKHVSSVAKNLSQAAANYEKTDENVAKSATNVH